MKRTALSIAVASSFALLPLGAVQADDADTQEDAREQVMEAAKVAADMKADPEVASLLARAKGVFIVPDYGRAALIVGGEGGEGLMLARDTNEWSGPVFYNIGAITAGVQAGVSAGSIAMILMTDRAVESFKQDDNFSLDADLGLTIVNYSARAQASLGKGDVILWAEDEGAFANASIGVSDIAHDDDETRAFYGKNAEPADVLEGKVETPAAKSLQDALSI